MPRASRTRAAVRRTLPALAAAVLAATLSLPATAGPSLPPGKSVATLRVMLNPSAAPAGMLPEATRKRLEALAGVPLVDSGRTRTGAIEFTVAGGAHPGTLAARLRADRAVLWAEAATKDVMPKSGRVTRADAAPAQKLLVRFTDGADEGAALARLAALAGGPVTVERTIGAVKVLALSQSRPVSEVDGLARAFESDAAVRYADAVRRVAAHGGLPNDPYFAQQWALQTVEAPKAWEVTAGAAGVTVAVVDSGILSHPDLDGRMLPGYDFISDADRGRDGDARDGDPRDEGDWHGDGECGGLPAQSSFFHGLFVAGLIAANADNAIGIAGLDRSARILPVRALGKCGGTFEDVLAAVSWAAGVPVPGAPANPHPARVINLSLGGPGTCPAAVQEVIDEALAQGTVIVASAGNENDQADLFSPGNCSGVINVAALSRSGDRASYSNFGARVDLAAPGGDVDEDGAMVSTHNAGRTTPGDASYDFAIGTSFAAPLVSATASMMLARNPTLTAGQVLSILQGTTREYPFGTPCRNGACGAGALDAGTALQSTIPAVLNLPQAAVAVVEYYDSALDHYLVTSDPAEIASLDQSGEARWQRTGQVFYAWSDPALAPAGAMPRNVCRFYAGPQHQIDSHYFTADPARCAYVLNNAADVWTLQSSAAFWVEVPDASGACRTGTLPVFAFFNNRRDANHRYTIDLSVRRAMINRAWVPDGVASNGAAFCSLI